MDQIGNNFVPSPIIVDNNNENFQNISNIGMSNTLHANATASAPQNITFEFYLPLRIYHITYIELDSLEIVQNFCLFLILVE